MKEGLEQGIIEISGDSRIYPSFLKSIPDPPDSLYLRGDAALLGWEPKIAIIGSRQPTNYGIRIAQTIAQGLAIAGVCVVSGLARGIDGIAHQATLDAGGKTIAILGAAIDEITPRSNLSLGREIVKCGLVLSEYPPGSPMRNWNFVARNRLISGLSRAVVVVEAAEKSGTLGTVKWALDQGKEVMAVPGPVDAEKSVGTLQLIREGARCVCSASDILSDLGLETGFKSPTLSVTSCNHREKQDPLMRWLTKEPIHMDILLEKSGLSPERLSQALLNLELSGIVKRLPGQRYLKV